MCFIQVFFPPPSFLVGKLFEIQLQMVPPSYHFFDIFNPCNRLLVGGFNPSEKYARQIGSFPQFSWWK